MTGLAIPVYATPMLAMTQLGMMFRRANCGGCSVCAVDFGGRIDFGLLG
jgi:hypothetical protein